MIGLQFRTSMRVNMFMFRDEIIYNLTVEDFFSALKRQRSCLTESENSCQKYKGGGERLYIHKLCMCVHLSPSQNISFQFLENYGQHFFVNLFPSS